MNSRRKIFLNTLRIVLLSPLALIRLILIFIISMTVSFSGILWLRLFGFSRGLQNVAMKSWGRSILFVCGIIVKRTGLPDNGHFIIMPNHRGYHDIFIIAAYTPAAFIGKAELKSWPLIRHGFRLTNSIFVNRSELQSLISTMNKIKSSVSGGIPVAVFPEGTTFKGPYAGPFKKGSFKIAADTQIPVIPMAIHYEDENDSWIDKDTFIGHFFRQLSKPLTRISVSYGSPVVNNDYKILMEEIRRQINTMLDNLITRNTAKK